MPISCGTWPAARVPWRKTRSNTSESTLRPHRAASTPETGMHIARIGDMYLTGALHVALALVALVSGLVMVLMRKGTVRHRKIGWIYAVRMLGLNATALLIYRLFGGFGPFHVAALVSLLTIIAGLIPVVLRRPRRKWLEHHAYWMTWSYVGLVAATASEVTTRVPASPFWWMVFGSSLVVIGGGRHLINSRVPIALQRIRGLIDAKAYATPPR